MPPLPDTWPADGTPIAVIDHRGKFAAWAAVDWSVCPYVSPLSRRCTGGGWQLPDLTAAASAPHGGLHFANGNPLDLRASNVSAPPEDAVTPSGACEDHCFQARIGPGARVSLVDLSDSSVVFWLSLPSRPCAAQPAVGGSCVYVLLTPDTALEARPDGTGRLLSTTAFESPVYSTGSGTELDPFFYDVPVAPFPDPPLAFPCYGGGFEFRARSWIASGPLEKSPFGSMHRESCAPPEPLPPPNPNPTPHCASGPWWMTYRMPRASRAPRAPVSIPADLAIDLLDEDAPVRPVRSLRSLKPRKARTGPVVVTHEIPDPKPAKKPKRSAPIRDGFRGKLVGSGLNARWAPGSAGVTGAP